MLPEGQDEGKEVKGLFKVICCALVGHSPAPHGPHCPSEALGDMEKVATQNDRAPHGYRATPPSWVPFPMLPSLWGWEKLLLTCPGGCCSSVGHIPLCQGLWKRSVPAGRAPRALQGTGDALGAGAGSWNLHFPDSALRDFPTAAAALKIPHSLQAGLTAATSTRAGAREEFEGVLEEFWRSRICRVPCPSHRSCTRPELARSTNIPTVQPWSLSHCHMESRE